MTEKTKTNLQYELSMEDKAEKFDNVFIDKQTASYLVDQNNSGLYHSNQIEFNTLSAANSGRILDFANAYIDLPLVITVKGTAIDSNPDDYIMALKNMHVTLVEQCNIEIAGVSINNAGVNNLAMYQNFKAHTRLSYDDEINKGSFYGYAKDSSDTMKYDNAVAGTVAGKGLMNNVANNGFKTRAKWFTRNMAKITSSGLLGENRDAVELNLRQADMNYWMIDDADTVTYYYTAHLPLKQLHPFFEKMPLCTGVNLKIKLYHNCKFVLKLKNDGATMSVDSVNITGGSDTLPIMLTGNASKFGTGAVTITSNVCDNQTSPQKHIKAQCRLYYGSYKASPQYHSMFLSNPVKSIKYNDLLYYSKAVTPNESFQFVLSSTIQRCSKLVIIAQLMPNANDGVVSNTQSPFDSAPATCVPTIIENLNVKVDENNIFATPINFKNELLVDEVGKYGVNYGLLDGVSSSRISMDDMIKNYSYYVFDVKNYEDSYSNVMHSISVIGKLKSSKAVTLHCFVEYSKSISINVITGAVEA